MRPAAAPLPKMIILVHDEPRPVEFYNDEEILQHIVYNKKNITVKESQYLHIHDWDEIRKALEKLGA